MKGNYPDSGWVPVEEREGKKDKIKGKWWTQAPNKTHEAVFPLVSNLRARNEQQYIRFNRFQRLYELGDATVYHESMKSQKIRGFMSRRLHFNLLASCVDTAGSKIAGKKPRPVYMGAKGSWEQGQRAKAMTNFMEGMFQTVGQGQGDERSMYGIGRRVFVGAAVQGIDGAKFYGDYNTGKVHCDKIHMHEIVVDEFEALYGPPKSLHHHVQLPKDVVKGMFPDKKHHANIDKATVVKIDEQQHGPRVEYIDVIESWHLPTNADRSDGLHSICIDCATLVEEKWEKEYYPILFYRWKPRLTGFFGIGLGEELYGLQFEINKLLYTIQLAQHLVAVPQVWMDYMSASIPPHLNNQIGAARYYKGRPPTFVTPQAMSAEVYNHLENLYRKAYEITGVSLMSATSRKPSGLDSGVALREYKDIQTERFKLTEDRYEDWFMDAAGLIEDICEDMHKAGVEVMAEVKHGQYLQRLKWKDVRIPKDRRIVRPHPSNILPSTPAGKLQTVQEMVQAGFFDKEEALELLDYPDLQKVKRLKTAGRNIIMKIIEEMLDTGNYIAPEPFMDLEKARPMAQNYYLEAKINGAPEDRLELLRRFMADVEGLLSGGTDEAAAMQQQAMMEQQAQAAQAQAVPEPQPTSQLLPQVQ